MPEHPTPARDEAQHPPHRERHDHRVRPAADGRPPAGPADKVSAQIHQLTRHVDDALDEGSRADAAAEEKLEGALAGLEERPAAMAGPVKPLAEGSGSTEPAATPTATATAAATAAAAESATPGGAARRRPWPRLRLGP